MATIVKETFIPAVIDVVSKMGWEIRDYEDCDCLELITYSPAGENLIVSVPKGEEDAAEFLRNYARDFDEEEHVLEMLKAKENGLAGVPDTATLLQDAKDIYKMLNELADAVGKVKAFDIPVVWQQMGYLTCYGTSHQNAAEIASDYDSDSESGDGLPLPKDGWYLDDSFEIDMDGIEPDPPKLTEMQQRVYDESAKYAIHGCSYERAIQIVEENIPHFFIETTEGEVFVSWIYYDEDEGACAIYKESVPVSHWMQRFYEVRRYVNEKNFANFFSEMDDWACAQPDGNARRMAAVNTETWDELAKAYWGNQEMKEYSLDTLLKIAHEAQQTH